MNFQTAHIFKTSTEANSVSRRCARRRP